jgi:hypothetical protein
MRPPQSPPEGFLPSAAEAVAAAVLAEFRRTAEETRERHASSPGAETKIGRERETERQRDRETE